MTKTSQPTSSTVEQDEAGITVTTIYQDGTTETLRVNGKAAARAEAIVLSIAQPGSYWFTRDDGYYVGNVGCRKSADAARKEAEKWTKLGPAQAALVGSTVTW